MYVNFLSFWIHLNFMGKFVKNVDYIGCRLMSKYQKILIKNINERVNYKSRPYGTLYFGVWSKGKCYLKEQQIFLLMVKLNAWDQPCNKMTGQRQSVK